MRGSRERMSPELEDSRTRTPDYPVIAQTPRPVATRPSFPYLSVASMASVASIASIASEKLLGRFAAAAAGALL